MLIVTRKQGEKIEVGDDIVISIGRIMGNRVQVGIAAPESLNIRRAELTRLVGVQLWEGDRMVGYVQVKPSEAEEVGRRHESKGGGRRYQIDGRDGTS